MEVNFGPNAVEEPNLLYKLQRKIKVFNTLNNLPNRGYNLVTSSSKYGLVFVASPDGTLLVYYLKELIDKELDGVHLVVRLQEKPTHVAVSCDQELLSVTGGQLLSVYKITDFQNQNPSPTVTLKYDVNPISFVSGLQWNPCVPDSIAIAFNDGTLIACQVSTSQIKKVQSKCRCLCWSPKGKQFVTGNNDGTLTQYKPDLTPAKTVPAPNLFESSPVEALAVYWISTFQFAVVYKNATDNTRPAVTIINTPKGGQLSCLNYEDICYSMGTNRPWYYYLQSLAQWNIILSSSSNSMEIASLGSTDGASWMQWCQTDEARPELPLTDKKQENYPVGLWIDTCAVHQLPWGENETLPPMPMLLVMSQTGLLTLFNIINLNKQAAQVCSPPQPLALPVTSMTAAIPDDAPQVAPQTVAAKPQPPTQPSIQVVPSSSLFGTSAINTSVKPSMPATQAFVPNITPQVVEQKQPVAVKPTPQAQPQVSSAAAPKPQPQSAATVVQPTPQSQESFAAMKAEQERIKANKANQELKNILIKEVNDFQMELYKFMVNANETQVKLHQDIESINCKMNMKVTDAEQLRKDLCSLEDLRNAIVQLKLDLVRSCAVVAEARTHADAKDIQQWTQADPLTTKRVANVKKLAYYVQNQVEHAYKALDHKRNDMAERDPKLYKPGQRMIRPILDDVYQPLVKQQEILSRQQVVLKSLRNTMKEIDAVPLFKSTSLLRSTPFKNKDPLSKLTKNILNMSIEPQTKAKEPCLNGQKLDALRDMLSNHKTIKIKPVNVELRQQLATMRLNYEKSLKEKVVQQSVVQQVEVKKEPQPFAQYIQPTVAPPAPITKFEPKRELKAQPINVPSFTPVTNNIKPAVPAMNNVARTLFMDELKPEPKPVNESVGWPHTSNYDAKPPSNAFSSPSASANTKSVLKDLLQNKQAMAAAAAAVSAAAASKVEANSFFGQKICSPTAFSFSSTNVPSNTGAPSLFSAKPASDINIMMNKFGTQVPESKPIQSISQKSSETGEPEIVGPQDQKKAFTSVYDSKSFVPLTNKPTETKPQEIRKIDEVKKIEISKVEVKVPEVPKIEVKAQEPPKPVIKPQEVNVEAKPKEVGIPDTKSIKVSKADEKSKENIPNENILKELNKGLNDKKDIEVKPITTQNTNAPSVLAAALQPAISTVNISTSESQKPAESKTETTESSKEIQKPLATVITSASSIFAAANASSPTVSTPQTVISSAPSTPTGSIFDNGKATTPTSPTDKPSLFASTTTSSASSIFGAAVASQQSPTQTGSLFGTTTATPSSVFGSTSTGSIFGTTTTTSSSVFGTSTTPSSFSGEAKPSVFSTTPTTPTSVFGTSSPAFAAAPPTSVFSSATTGSIFGTATTQASVFGTSTSTTSVFGTVTTQPSVFGTPTSTPSVFETATSQASIFGSPATTSQSVFGSNTATTQSSVFGTQTSQASVFGSTSPANQGSIFGSPSTQSSVFGTPTQPTQASVFGSTQTTQASLFGAPPATTAQSGSLFGGAESNLFAAASISTTSAPSQASSGNIFGSTSPTSVFGGSGGNVFGGKSTFSQSNPTAASIFGGGASFGQKQSSNFWSGGNNASGNTGFGSGFGQQQQQPAQTGSIFGGGSTGSFSSPTATAQPFGSPQANTFGTGDSPSIFGSPQQQNATAFGGSPVFASKPAFGQTAGFGSPTSSGFSSFGGFNKSPSGFGAPASFGSGATFGGTAFGNTSPGKMFGGSPPGGFGSPTQSNATFESLATQNTLTFGNLAQQSGQPPPQPAPSFNASPAFTGWRG